MSVRNDFRYVQGLASIANRNMLEKRSPQTHPIVPRIIPPRLKLPKEVNILSPEIETLGIKVGSCGIGDALQFSSLPENYFAITGKKIVDLQHHWMFDHNPYIIRDHTIKCDKTVTLWNYPKQYDWQKPRQTVYMNNAEIHAFSLGLPSVVLTRPRLYQYEDFPFAKRKNILLHMFGRSHQALPQNVIDHIVKKYGSLKDVYQVGHSSERSIGVKRIETKTMWDIVKVVSECRMIIGIDSGVSWIGACYPDVVIKKIRTKFQGGLREPEEWIPLDVHNEHAFWDDTTLATTYNCTNRPLGFTRSYLEI